MPSTPGAATQHEQPDAASVIADKALELAGARTQNR